MHLLAPQADQSPPRIEISSLDDVFEVVTRAVFQAGLAWAVVDARWPAFERALEGFDVHAVADYGPHDVERLLGDATIVRHRHKLEATVRNARRLVALEREHGSFEAWLAEHEGHDAACAALRSELAYLGAFGATWVLHVLGGPVPPYAEWSRLGTR